MMNIRYIFSTLCLVAGNVLAFGQSASTEQRINNLVQQMTLQEKIGQMNQNSYFGLGKSDIIKLQDEKLYE